MEAPHALVLGIFALTYVLIAARRLELLPIGRPAGALLGAVAMVGIGAISPAESYAAIDHDTLLLLFGMMLLVAELELAGFFELVSRHVLGVCKTPWRLLAALSLLSALLSAFLVNDTVCLFLTPVVVLFCRHTQLPMGPYLIALATSANIGSSATMVGNPQNMLIGSMSGLGFVEFIGICAPAAVAGVFANLGLLWLYYRHRLPAELPATDGLALPGARDIRRLVLASSIIGLVVIGFFCGLHLGYASVGGAVILFTLVRDEPGRTFARVDWTLLVFFAALFIVVAALERTGLVDEAWTALAPGSSLENPTGMQTFVAAIVVGSNLVSNVPLVMLVGPYLSSREDARLAWGILAYVATVAGNLTLVGSVANIIVAQGARDHYELGFWEYLRFGFVSTLVTLVVGVPLIFLAA